MYFSRKLRQNWGRQMRSEKGFSLIETLIAICLLGIIGVGFLSGLSTTFIGAMVSQERVAAESLSKSQLEYIKVQDYIATADYDPDDPDKRYNLIDIPSDLVDEGYSIQVNPPEIVVSPGDDEFFELQSITVVIERNDEEMLTISGYKAGRTS